MKKLLIISLTLILLALKTNAQFFNKSEADVRELMKDGKDRTLSEGTSDQNQKYLAYTKKDSEEVLVIYFNSKNVCEYYKYILHTRYMASAIKRLNAENTKINNENWLSKNKSQMIVFEYEEGKDLFILNYWSLDIK